MKKLLTLTALFTLCGALSLSAQTLNCGFALGYPPYQFQEKNLPAGLDLEIATALFASAGLDVKIQQGPWDDMVAKLRFSKGVEIIGGMEIDDTRLKLFDFTTPLYMRKNVIFVLDTNTDIKGLKDLVGKTITGDRHSYTEDQLAKSGDLTKVRIIQTDSKEEAMKLLKEGKVVASLMPDAVGFYIAKKLGIKVKVVEVGDPGSPVAFAVLKGNKELLEKLNIGVAKIQGKGLQKILSKWLN